MDKISGTMDTKEKYKLIVKNSSTKYIMFGRKLVNDNLKYFLNLEIPVAKEHAMFRGNDDIDWDDFEECLKLAKVVYRGEHEASDTMRPGAYMDLYFATTKKCKFQYKTTYPITLGFDIDSSLNAKPYLVFGIMAEDLVLEGEV